MRSLASLAIVAGVVALILLYPYGVIAALYLVPFLLTKLMLENFYVLKARSLGKSVYEVKAEENSDDYLEEKTQVHSVKRKGGNHEEN